MAASRHCLELKNVQTTMYICGQPNTILNMDRFSFQEAVLAEYISDLQSRSRSELVNELVDLKFSQLEALSDEALIGELNVQRRKQES